ncbi:hypothetical protein ABZP36_031397 [Zizania latifolia]
MMPLGKHMTGECFTEIVGSPYYMTPEDGFSSCNNTYIGFRCSNVTSSFRDFVFTRSGDGRPGGGRSGGSTLGSGRSDASIEVIDVEKGVASIALPGISNQLPVDVLHTVFSAFGTVQKIAMSEKNGGMQALIQYPVTYTK